MWPDRISNPGPLAHVLDALPTALRDPARAIGIINFENIFEILVPTL